MADAKFANKQAVMRKLALIPDKAIEIAAPHLKEFVETMGEALKRAAPVDHEAQKDRPPGELRESIHAYPNPERPLSWRIICGARDEKGRFYGRYVEFGHGAAGPRPFWFVTYRAQKRVGRRKMYSAVRKELKLWFEGA